LHKTLPREVYNPGNFDFFFAESPTGMITESVMSGLKDGKVATGKVKEKHGRKISAIPVYLY
jgi:hypothetical protein